MMRLIGTYLSHSVQMDVAMLFINTQRENLLTIKDLGNRKPIENTTLCELLNIRLKEAIF